MTCRTLRIPYRPAYSPGGPHILYTRAQVAARKALWAKLGAAAVVCTVAATGYTAAQHAPAGWLGIPEPLPAIHAPVPVWRGMPPEPVWRATGLPVHAVPEPGTALVLGISFVVLVGLRKRRRHRRPDLFIHPADPERGYQQAALSLHDAVGREP